MKRAFWLSVLAVAAVFGPPRPPCVRAEDPTPTPTPPPSGPAAPAAPPPVVAAPLPAPAPAAPGPVLKLERMAHDFGILKQNQDLTAKIKYTNAGTKALHVTARGECSCAQAAVSKKTLEPGESGELELTFHSYQFHGKLTKHVTVTSDDPTQAELHVEVKADISAGILVEPANFFFNAALVGTSPTATIKVKYKMGVGRPFRVLEVKPTGTGVGDVWFDAKAFFEGDWKGYEVTMKFRTPPPIGLVSGDALIVTDDPDYKSIKCLIGGMVSGKVFIAQTKTSIGIPVEGKEVVLKLGCRGFDDTIDLGEVTAKSRKGIVNARAVRDPNDPKSWVIEITLPGTTPVGAVSDVVEVTTAVAGFEHHQIEVAGTVVAKPK